MMFNLVKKILPALFFLSVLNVNAQVQFTSGSLRLGLDKKGFLTELSNQQSGKNYLFTDSLSALLSVVSNNKKYLPATVVYNSSSKTISLKYQPIDVTIEIKVTPKNTHLTLEIVKATPTKNIDAVIWGPFKTTIHKTVGEVIGVVRDEEVAVGMQVLNVKTLGGNFPNSEGSNWGRGIAATAYPWGSTLQAYTINRDRERRVDAWGGAI